MPSVHTAIAACMTESVFANCEDLPMTHAMNSLDRYALVRILWLRRANVNSGV